MIVLDLACARDHRFEGWFASADEFDSQCARSLVQCPVCASQEVRRLLSAPRLNLARAGDPAPKLPVPVPAPGGSPPSAEVAEAMHARLLQMARMIVQQTDDVGERFAEEARRIHYREAPARGIRGVASPGEVAELGDEGIEVFAFPIPDAAKNPLQ